MAVLVNRQRELAEVGIIRIGHKVPATKKDGGTFMRPASLTTFRFTSRHRDLIDMVASRYGGEVSAWEGKPGQWEVITHTREIPALFSTSPKGDGDCVSLSQHLEMWQGGKNVRRCNGEICDIWKGGQTQAVPCLCRYDSPDFRDRQRAGETCKLVSRIRVILPEIPSLGMWRLNTGSNVFDQRINGFLEQIRSLGFTQGAIPVRLAISQVEKRKGPDAAPELFPVVDISIDQNPPSIGAMIHELQAQAMRPAIEMAAAVSGELPPPPAALPPTAVAPDDDFQALRDWLKAVGFKPDDFVTWAQSEGIPNWQTAAIQAKRAGCETAEAVEKFILDRLASKGAGS